MENSSIIRSSLPLNQRRLHPLLTSIEAADIAPSDDLSVLVKGGPSHKGIDHPWRCASSQSFAALGGL